MKGFENNGPLLTLSLEERERESARHRECMENYKGSPSFEAYQRKECLKRLLRNAPTMDEARVVELMTSAEFSEFPDDPKQALSDRMLQLEIKPD